MKKYLLLLSCLIVSQSYMSDDNYKSGLRYGMIEKPDPRFQPSYRQRAHQALGTTLDWFKPGSQPALDIQRVIDSGVQAVEDHVKYRRHIYEIGTMPYIRANPSHIERLISLAESAIRDENTKIVDEIAQRFTGYFNLLWFAMQYKNLFLIRWIVIHRLSNLHNKKTILSYALQQQLPSSMIKLLVKHNADVNNGGSLGIPLVLAVTHYHGEERYDIIKCLVEHGAHVNVRDRQGRDLFELLMQSDSGSDTETTTISTLDFLVQHGLER